MEEKDRISIIECPRDAMQGINEFIPTATKIKYLNLLLKCGFSCLDFGSFVSPKAIPQLRDTKEVLAGLENITMPLIAIVANLRGAKEASICEEISFLGFPFSVSETFQMRNANKTIQQAYEEVLEMQELCSSKNKRLLIYISMGFGNPYGDVFNEEIVQHWIEKLSEAGIRDFNLSDTIGVAKPETITNIFSKLKTQNSKLQIGAHFHSTPSTQIEKIEAAYLAGCRSFDAALGGFGGCPMAKDDLTGNLSTEALMDYFREKLTLNLPAILEAQKMADEIFTRYH